MAAKKKFIAAKTAKQMLEIMTGIMQAVPKVDGHLWCPVCKHFAVDYTISSDIMSCLNCGQRV